MHQKGGLGLHHKGGRRREASTWYAMEVQKADLPSLALGVDDSEVDLPCVGGDDVDLPSRGDDGAELPWW
ncbi:hypothetical protein PR202_ga18083 [Eleusine coracana subsp. coracana]|uniref:Uncharacterized protein n=1 Tax=Eleusine coracana subsp. coracana TaxID=191504 RepID=A0AAV5CSG8_ELECO|nr:hypothetical protein PR202_ga18083 [Eleusine coracana subsp. coracana]